MKMGCMYFEDSWDLCEFVNSRKIPKENIVGIVFRDGYEETSWMLFYYKWEETK
nr:MAG TPA: hypothetical protein [Bacteriophage sp.]